MSKNDSDVPNEAEEFLYVPLEKNWMYGHWDTTGRSRRSSIKLRWIENFDARWMRRVYGRSDIYPWEGRRQRITFSFAMWLTRDGRVVARFSSRSKDIDTMSVEVVDMKLGTVPDTLSEYYNEEFVPQILRDAYADWQLRSLENAGLW
jgi:hypothetical protein